MKHEPDHRPEEQVEEATWVSNSTLQLELRALRAEQSSEHKSTRLWLAGAVAASGLLQHVTLPTTVGVPAALGVIAAVAAKVVFFK